MTQKILVYAGYFYPHLGGSEQVVCELSKGLAKIEYEIDIITCNTENVLSYEEIHGFHVYRLDSWNILGGTYPVPKPTLFNFRTLVEISKCPHDLIFTFTRFFTTSFVGLMMSKLKMKQLIHTELGSSHSIISNKILDSICKIYDHTFGTLIVRSADKLICNCNLTVHFLKHLGAKKDISVSPCGVNLSLFAKKQTNLKNRIGLDDEAIIITSVSRLIYAKGIQDLILAFPRIRQEEPNAKLLIIGSGSYRQELDKIVEEIGSEGILFFGQISHEEVAEVLNITDIFVNPSYSEALTAYPVIEAGAMGVPSVTTDVGGTREVIEDYETGLLIKAGDIDDLGGKICELIKNKDLRDKIGTNIQHFVTEKFGWDGAVQFYHEQIESISVDGDKNES